MSYTTNRGGMFRWRHGRRSLLIRPFGFGEPVSFYPCPDGAGWRWKWTSGGCWSACMKPYRTALAAVSAFFRGLR